MRLSTSALIAFLLVATPGAGVQSQATSDQPSTPCPVTEPNGIVAMGGEQAYAQSGPGAMRHSYGNPQLSLGPFGLWPNGTVVFRPGGSGFVTSEGWLGMKFGWQRGARGRLTVEGRRLDGPAPRLLAESGGSGGDVFQATSLIFPTPGCWVVTGHLGDASLSFVTKVEKIGDGPAWRREHRRELSIVPVGRRPTRRRTRRRPRRSRAAAGAGERRR